MDVPKGTRVVEYKGRIQPWREVKHEDGYNGYLLRINSKTVINAKNAIRTFGRYANDARGLVRIKGLINNAEYVTEGGRCFIEAKRSIKKGEEILVSYGNEYWTLIRKILREKYSRSKQYLN